MSPIGVIPEPLGTSASGSDDSSSDSSSSASAPGGDSEDDIRGDDDLPLDAIYLCGTLSKLPASNRLT